MANMNQFGYSYVKTDEQKYKFNYVLICNLYVTLGIAQFRPRETLLIEYMYKILQLSLNLWKDDIIEFEKRFCRKIIEN